MFDYEIYVYFLFFSSSFLLSGHVVSCMVVGDSSMPSCANRVCQLGGLTFTFYWKVGCVVFGSVSPPNPVLGNESGGYAVIQKLVKFYSWWGVGLRGWESVARGNV